MWKLGNNHDHIVMNYMRFSVTSEAFSPQSVDL
jgi:hypothetical protein